MTLLTLGLIYSNYYPGWWLLSTLEVEQMSLHSYAYKMLSIVFPTAEELFSLLLDRQVYMVLLISHGFRLLQLSFVHDSH